MSVKTVSAKGSVVTPASSLGLFLSGELPTSREDVVSTFSLADFPLGMEEFLSDAEGDRSGKNAFLSVCFLQLCL